MVAIIILVIVFIIGKFFYDKSQQSTKISKEGGMLHKYKILADTFLSGDKNSKIYQVTSDSVMIGSSSIGGSTMYYLTQTFGKITIQWKLNSPIFGKHGLEWEFHEYLDQEKMLERIFNDLEKYQKSVITAQGYSLPKTEVPKPKKDLSELSKEDYEKTILGLLSEKDYAGALMLLDFYIEYYPSERIRLEKVKMKIEEKYLDSDEYKNSDLPF